MAASGETFKYKLPFPKSTDLVDVSGDIKLLADTIDSDIDEIIQDAVSLIVSASTPTQNDPTGNVGINVFYRDSTGKVNFTLDTNYLKDTVAPIIAHSDHIGLVSVYDSVNNQVVLQVTGSGTGSGSSNASLSDMWWLGV